MPHVSRSTVDSFSPYATFIDRDGGDLEKDACKLSVLFLSPWAKSEMSLCNNLLHSQVL